MKIKQEILSCFRCFFCQEKIVLFKIELINKTEILVNFLFFSKNKDLLLFNSLSAVKTAEEILFSIFKINERNFFL